MASQVFVFICFQAVKGKDHEGHQWDALVGQAWKKHRSLLQSLHWLELSHLGTEIKKEALKNNHIC